MVTEADWGNWKYHDFVPYLDIVFEAFGIQRVVYGSDWPVCLVAASYHQMKGIVDTYLSQFSSSDQKLFFRENALRFYDLN